MKYFSKVCLSALVCASTMLAVTPAQAEDKPYVMSPFVFACNGGATHYGATSSWSYNVVAWSEAEAQALAMEIATGMHGSFFKVTLGSCTRTLNINAK